MSLYIDKKYINMLSPRLERFAWKKQDLANCRCPLCGDSKKNKAKEDARKYAPRIVHNDCLVTVAVGFCCSLSRVGGCNRSEISIAERRSSAVSTPPSSSRRTKKL